MTRRRKVKQKTKEKKEGRRLFLSTTSTRRREKKKREKKKGKKTNSRVKCLDLTHTGRKDRSVGECSIYREECKNKEIRRKKGVRFRSARSEASESFYLTSEVPR
jgi:outer membrane receptor for ferrienterochelin and colicin